jgi:hypothetical protein
MPRRVERRAEGVVERTQPHLVASRDLLARAQHARACTPLLCLDERADDPLDGAGRSDGTRAAAGAPS